MFLKVYSEKSYEVDNELISIEQLVYILRDYAFNMENKMTFDKIYHSTLSLKFAEVITHENILTWFESYVKIHLE